MRNSRVTLVWVLLLFFTPSAWAALPLEDSEGKQLPSLAPMLERVNAAVVNISTFATRSTYNPLLNDPFFRHFFNIPDNAQPQQQRRSQSAGSGVIIDAEEGVVITNAHVVDGADEIKVSLNDGRILEAKLLGSDPEVDIAVLKVKPDNLTELKLADSERVRVGDFVVAIGNPFGLGQTVTTGVVSALSRSGLGIEGYENFIQTDASINPGNSGGALVDLNGDLVGINTAILAPAGGNIGIGFAIPINMALHSVDQIRETGEVKRGQLGIVIQDLTPELAEAFDIKGRRGVVVAEVQEDSAAEDAGIKAGDVIIEMDDKLMTSAGQLRNVVGLKQIGDKVKIKLLRDGSSKTFNVKIGERTTVAASTKGLHKSLEGANLVVSQDPQGVKVESITPMSPAARSGLQPGDIIISANNQKVQDIKDLGDALAKRDQNVLRVRRGNMALYLVLR